VTNALHLCSKTSSIKLNSATGLQKISLQHNSNNQLTSLQQQALQQQQQLQQQHQ
jgi:hypothetical protein